MQQLRLGLLALGDVGLRACDTRRPAVGIAYGQTAHHHPALFAVGVQHAVFALEVIAVTGQVRVQRRMHPRLVIGMNTLHPLVRMGAYVVFGVAQHPLPAWRVVGDVGGQIPVPQAVVGAARGKRIALLAGLQGVQRVAGAGKVA